MRVLVLGAGGMLGNAVFRSFSRSAGLEVFGTLRSGVALGHFGDEEKARLSIGIDVEHQDSLNSVFVRVRPDVVINCIGLVKQIADSNDPLAALPINALLPHRLARICELIGARLVHISTDCVFSGRKGAYREDDVPDAEDLYGRSKLLGEVTYPHSITLRTSIIGHELDTSHGLVEWFLAQKGSVSGYTKAIFSGLPTIELARVIEEFVLPRPELSGLYHVASDPISKYELLEIVAQVYEKSIAIEPDDSVVIDRSLNSERFSTVAEYQAPKWDQLVKSMCAGLREA